MVPRLFVALACLVLARSAAAELRAARVFGDHMVLQRSMAVPVWGWAEPGQKVTVRFAGQVRTADADAAGRWVVRLAPMRASARPREMTVTAGGSAPLRFADVLVGEVWVLAGQSNMTWWLSESTGGKAAARRADYPWLRHFVGSWGHADEPAPDVVAGCRWMVCTPETIGQTSAIGFFFAEALHRAIGVPVGLLDAAMPATWGNNWLPRRALAARPALRHYLDDYEKALKDYPARYAEWKVQRAEFDRQAEEARKAGKPGPAWSYDMDNGPMGPTHPRRPAALYNGMIAPLQPYAIRGALWYQGEGDTAIHTVPHYQELLTALITSWREDWGQGDFPFLMVQLPRLYYADPWHSWPLFREIQARVAGSMKRVGLAVTIDTGERDNVHPADKRPVGERLARLARAIAYGQRIETSGPRPASAKFADGRAVVVFRHAAAGLRAAGGTLTGFSVCGADRRFVPASASITGKDSVTVTSPQVPQPIAVRYAWEPLPDCSLQNSEGLPAPPFRTDDFDVGHYESMDVWQKSQEK